MSGGRVVMKSVVLEGGVVGGDRAVMKFVLGEGGSAIAI